MRGAVGDLDRVLAILAKTGFSEDRFYIHCDGALFGLMVRAQALIPPRCLSGPSSQQQYFTPANAPVLLAPSHTDPRHLLCSQ